VIDVKMKPDFMRRLLGEMLIAAKVVTPRQLDDSINNQVIYGGRLGTNLIELGYLTENVLADFLSRQHGVPTIAPAAYAKVQTAVAKLLPKSVAERTMTVPLVLKDRTLHVVMADPNNVGLLDEVRFASGKRIEIYVAPEVRVYFLLNKLYGTKRDVRFVTLSRAEKMAVMAGGPGGVAPAVKESRARSLSMDGVADDTQTGELMSEAEFSALTHGIGMGVGTSEVQAAEEEAVLLGDLQEDEEELIVLDDEIPAEAPAAAQPQPIAAAPAAPVQADDTVAPRQLTLAQATKALQHVEHRDQIARVVLGFASATFKRTVLFMVRPDMVMGWDAHGKGLSRESVEHLMVPLSAPSVFKLVCESRSHFLGAIPKSPVNTRFVKLLGGDEPRSAFIIPIVFKGKVVNILYGDNGPATSATFDIGELLILAMKVPQSFEDLVARMKKASPV
jgi:hypothetical protein